MDGRKVRYDNSSREPLAQVSLKVFAYDVIGNMAVATSLHARRMHAIPGC